MFNGTADFDPGNGIVSLDASAAANAFVVKLSPAGNLTWARALVSTDISEGFGILHFPEQPTTVVNQLPLATLMNNVG